MERQVAGHAHPRPRGAIGALLLSAFAAASCGSDGTGPGALLASLAISPPAPLFEPGTTLQFTAMGSYDDGSSSDVTATATWTSSNPAVLTISNAAGTRGSAQRLTAEAVTVTATIGSISASVDVGSWCTTLVSGIRFDGDVGGTGTGFGIGRLTADAGAVYWAGYDGTAGGAGGFIAGVPKAGGPVVQLATGLGGINDLISDGAHIYWTEYDPGTGDGAIKRVPVAGGAIDVLATGTPAGSTYDVFFPEGIVVDASFVYWGEQVGGGAVRRVAKVGGAVTDLARGSGFGPSSLEIGAQHLYGVANNTGTAGRVALANGTYQQLASGLGNPDGTALDAQSFYWAELVGEPNGRVAAAPAGGGSVTALATGLDNPRGVAVWDGVVYYTGTAGAGNQRRSGVWRVPASGGSAELAAGLCGAMQGSAVRGLVVDANHIFYVESGVNGRVLRAPRQ